MDPDKLVDQLLENSGAELIRSGKHLVYRLPNGRRFTRSNTPGDNRGAWNNYSDLKHELGRVGRPQEPPAEAVPPQEAFDNNGNFVAPVEVEPVEPPPVVSGLRERIQAAIDRENGLKERMFAEATLAEKRVTMLESILPFADDLAIEAVLRDLIPAVVPVHQHKAAPKVHQKPKHTGTPRHPDQIGRAVQITRQLVFAATQTFSTPFTNKDILDRMVGDTSIDGLEYEKSKTAIGGMLNTLLRHGHVLKEKQGIGKQHTLWRRLEGEAVRHVSFG